MGDKTKIEWTDATWNPILGCSRVSEGCRNCYAERMAGRFPNQAAYSGLTQIVNGRAVWTGQIKETKKLLEPLSWRTPKRVFVNSMSDLFHENVSDEMRDRIFAVMALCPQHTFQVLTKRPERMREYISTPLRGHNVAMAICDLLREGDRWFVVKVNEYSDWLQRTFSDGDGFIRRWPLPHVWLGVSVENQKAADERIPLLLQTPTAVRFISAEPLVGPIMLPRQIFLPRQLHGDWPIGHTTIADMGKHVAFMNPHGALSVKARDGFLLGVKPSEREYIGLGLDWVICGGESGPGARPMHPDWARSLRDQCQAAGVPFFFKQWGEWWPKKPEENLGLLNAGAKCHEWNGGLSSWRIGKKAAGALLDGREWKQFPGAR